MAVILHEGIYSGFAYPIRSITDGKWKYIKNLNYEEQFQNIMTHGFDFNIDEASQSWKEWKISKDSNIDEAKWVTMYQSRPHEELYDLTSDPHEIKNIANDDADRSIKTKLAEELSKWMAQQNDLGLQSEMKVALKARDMSKVPSK